MLIDFQSEQHIDELITVSSLYVCVRTFMHMCLCVCTFVYACFFDGMCVYCVCVYVRACMCIHVHACMCVCMRMCVYLLVSVCLCMGMHSSA